METYVVELEGTELDSFALTVPALPDLLILLAPRGDGDFVQAACRRPRAAEGWSRAASISPRVSEPSASPVVGYRR